MIYESVWPAVFLDRPNRFIALVLWEGQTVTCHVKNTGRCRELLIPGAKVYVQKVEKVGRKTKFDLIGVEKGTRLINIDSQAPNKVVADWLLAGCYFPEITFFKSEVAYGSSRFDFYLESGRRKVFVEVKGVTLEEDGVALFPDAPTERGVKHIRELCGCVSEGYEGMAVFLVQMKGVQYFTPNDQMHGAFGEALRDAAKLGVQIVALDCSVTKDSIAAAELVEVVL